MHRAGSVLLLLGFLGCDSHPATQVIVLVHAAPSLRSDAATIAIRVEGPDGTVAIEREDPVPSGVGPVARVPIVPLGGDATRTFRLVATLRGAAGELARAEAVTGFERDRLREIHLWLDEACRGVTDCGPGRTCDRGVCVGSCYDAAAPGEVERSRARCGECEQCAGDACAPLADGAECGCPGTDRCAAGVCLTSAGVVGIWAGELHTCANVRDHLLYCWGSNRVGQLGTGGSETPSPAEVVGWGAIGAATATRDHTCIIDFNGGRACWGWNGNAQLGLGTAEEAIYDTPVEPPDGELQYSEMDTGWFHSCALTVDGRIYCWGSNMDGASGQLPAEGLVLSPEPLDERADYTAVTAGGFHDCAIRQGRAVCWGRASSGELGTGDRVASPVPREIACPDGGCLDDLVAISAGDFHTCAIRRGGELYCWGGGQNGQLGVGPTMTTDSPVPLRAEGDGYSAVAGGGSHTCAIREDGTLWCMGENVRGQLGVGDVLRRAVPTRVEAPGGDGWIRIAPGTSHTCAIRADETLWCWGENGDGQLGLGFVTGPGEPPVASPRRVCFPP